MIQLIGVRLVQFFLYEKRDVRVGRTCGIFGANGSGKSSLLDAVQIVMLGGSARRGSGVVFNAQADESNSNTRSIRSYCLGQYGDAEGARVRDDATSYITLVWIDTSTREIVSTGVCISASSRRDEHDILGRYIFSSDLTLNDHLEIVDGEERPREWGAFREQLRQRSRPNDEILFHDADRFIKALLLRLRGSGGVAQIDAFRQAFRFGLRMRFDQSIDQIVRHQVLEARPTNVQRFKEVFSTFKELSAKVTEVRAKITHAERIDKEYQDAERRQGHSVTWQALGKACEHEVANQAVEVAEEAEGKGVAALETAQGLERAARVANEVAASTSAEAASRRDTHASHGSKKFLEEQLAGARGREEAPRKELRATLSALAALLETAAKSDLVPKAGNDAVTAAQDLRGAIADIGLAERAAVDRVARRAQRAATSVVNGLFSVRAGIANDLARARECWATSRATAYGWVRASLHWTATSRSWRVCWNWPASRRSLYATSCASRMCPGNQPSKPIWAARICRRCWSTPSTRRQRSACTDGLACSGQRSSCQAGTRAGAALRMAQWQSSYSATPWQR